MQIFSGQFKMLCLSLMVWTSSEHSHNHIPSYLHYKQLCIECRRYLTSRTYVGVLVVTQPYQQAIFRQSHLKCHVVIRIPFKWPCYLEGHF